MGIPECFPYDEVIWSRQEHHALQKHITVDHSNPRPKIITLSIYKIESN